MNKATQKDPIIKRAKVKGTGLPIDGHTLTFGFWAYDGHKQPHLLDWEKDADEAVMKTMHWTDELYSTMPLEEFAKLWAAGEYESDGAFCVAPECVEVVNIECNAENISNSTVVQGNRAETIAVENKVQINSNNGGGGNE